MRDARSNVRWSRRLLLILLLLACTALAAGCTVIPSGRTAFPEGSAMVGPAPEGGTGSPAIVVPEDAIDARPVLEEAIRAMEEKANQYWYTGYIRNTMEDHLVNSMFDGVVLRPQEAYLINARIAGQPYQYYRYEGTNYIKDRNRWYPVKGEVPLAFDPAAGFEDWLPLMEQAVKRPDAPVLGVMAEVYEVRISGKTWVESSPSTLFDELREQATTQEELDRLLEQTIVKVTFKLDKVERTILEYETWIVMPLPAGGYVDQNTYVRLFRFDDPSIENQLPVPSRIQEIVDQYVIPEESMVDGAEG